MMGYEVVAALSWQVNDDNQLRAGLGMLLLTHNQRYCILCSNDGTKGK